MMTTADVDALVRSGLFQHAGGDELAQLAAALKQRSYRRGEVVYHQDDPPGGLFIIERGTVKMQLPSAGGKVFTIAWTPEGSFFGTTSLFGEIVRSETAVALEDSSLVLLDRPIFRSYLKRHPEAAEVYLEVLAGRWRRTLARLGDFMTLDILGRVSRVLLELLPNFGVPDPAGGTTIRLLTQVELASLTGASRESVAQALKGLAADGAVTVAGSHIRVREPSLLEAHLR